MRFFFIIFFLIIYFLSCNPGDQKNNQANSNIESTQEISLYVYLPPESFYQNQTYGKAVDTMFFIKDAKDKVILPLRDTILKGGDGLIEFNGLVLGKYTYNVKTIFNDTISGELNVTKSPMWFHLYPDYFYHPIDTISRAKLISADSIIIIFENENKNMFTLVRMSSKYSLQYFTGNPYKEEFKKTIDSATAIKAIVNFESTIMRVKNTDLGDSEGNSFTYSDRYESIYIKVNNEFLQSNYSGKEKYLRIHSTI